MVPWPSPMIEQSADEHKRIALGYITEAWIEAVKDGVDPDHMAVAVLEAAIRELVALRGEDQTIQSITAFPARIEAGEFSTYATRQ